MQATQTGGGGTGQLRLFIASLWLTLATALLCALVPAELPAGAAHGSAFSPANNVVAVHSGIGTNRALLKRIADKDPADTIGKAWLVPTQTALLAARAIAPALPAIAAATVLLPSWAWTLPYARGPPAA